MPTLLVLCLALSAAGTALAQTEREAARRAILEDELATEAKLFVEAHAELRDARGRNAAEASERLDRHRRNLATLTRELARGEAEPARLLLRKPEGGRPDWVISP